MKATKDKKRPARKPARNRKKRPALASNPLPPPLDIQTQPEPVPQSNEPKHGGFFEMLKANPLTVTEANPDTPLDGAASAQSSESFSTSSYDDLEAQRLLDSVPDVIGPEPGEAGAAPADVPPDVPAIQADTFVNVDALAGVFQGAFSLVGAIRKRDCYDLDDVNAAKLGAAWCPHVNGWLEKWLPGFLTQFAMANPGLVAAAVTTIGVVTPMVKADLAETRKERAKLRTFVREGTSHSAPAQPKPAQAGAMLHDLGEAA